MSSVTAQLTYFVPPADGSPAYNDTIQDPVTGERKTNTSRSVHSVEIHNLRGREDTVALQTAGFQLYKRPAKHASFQNDEEIMKEYYPETAELIKELTGASKVILFDHTIRRRRPGEYQDSPQKRQPVTMVHVDQTRAAAFTRVRKNLPSEEAEERLQKRFQIINLWRPIKHTANDWPLGLCDYSSVDADRDLVPLTLLFPDRTGETYGVQFNECHRWYYFKAMGTDECILLKCFDTVDDGSVAVFTPHTGFEDPTTPKGAPLRESIEVRALVFYD